MKSSANIILVARAKLVVFFVFLLFAASLLTLVNVNAFVYFGGDFEIGWGFHWDWSLFFSVITSFTMTPFVISYVNNEMAKINEAVYSIAGKQREFSLKTVKISPRAIKIFKLFLSVIALVACAAFYTLMIENLAFYYGGIFEIMTGIFWDFNIFFSYITGFIIVPIIYIFVERQIENIREVI